MKKSELKQIIKEEIKNILSESSDYPGDVVDTNGNIVTTQNGKKYKILTTKPKEGSSDFYYDTIMKRVSQLNPEDWDINVRTYKKAIPMGGEVDESLDSSRHHWPIPREWFTQNYTMDFYEDGPRIFKNDDAGTETSFSDVIKHYESEEGPLSDRM